MVEQIIVIRKQHLDACEKIVDYAMERIDFVGGYYSEDFAKFTKDLDFKLKKIAKRDTEKEMLSLSFTLDSIIAFKQLIYMFITKNIKSLESNDMESITSILTRLDEWIEEYMNINGDYYVEAFLFDKESSRYSRL